ncbi:MAG: GGDEF domain-containing protein [Lachnospirales bacterium]
MGKAERKQQIERGILAALLVLIVILISLLMNNVNNLQGTARVVNYTGIVRGATQRLVKLEIVEKPNDGLMENLDKIIYGLQTSSTEYDLVSLKDDEFQKNVSDLNFMWGELKSEIYKTRELGWENTNIIELSEEYFQLADKTVSSAEVYSQQIASKLKVLEIFVLLIIACLVGYIVLQIVKSFNLIKHNNMLKEKAYIDTHTMLPNKSKCKELLSDTTLIDKSTGVLVFDLNYLKQVNDTLGHLAGDTLIQNFGNVIRKNIPPAYFVGRNGGDEFISILYNVSEEEILEILDKIKISVERYNNFSQQIVMSYSVGYEISTRYSQCTLDILFQKADEHMYMNKEAFRKKNSSLDLRKK